MTKIVKTEKFSRYEFKFLLNQKKPTKLKKRLKIL